MVTSRARWLMGIAFAGAVIGLLRGSEPMALIGLAVLFWICAEWLTFLFRVKTVSRLIQIKRELSGIHGRADTVWVGQTLDITIRATFGGTATIPFVGLRDRVPIGVGKPVGDPFLNQALTENRELSFQYSIHPEVTGIIRFEGASVRFADRNGFFFSEQFVPDPRTVRVLPRLVEGGAVASLFKRFNMMPPPGLHRHFRPGIGFDLLELREYVPGDSPRNIAWKVSARRDRLMSKDFESEVPVRCTVFLDTSNSTRIGLPGPSPLAQLIETAGVLFQSATANRDPVGLCIFNENSAQFWNPAVHQKHIVKLLKSMVECCRPPVGVGDEVYSLLLTAYLFCREVYPDAVGRHFQKVPFRIFPLRPRRRRERRRRIVLSIFLSEYYGLDKDAPAHLMWDNRAMAHLLQRFLSEHQIAFPGPFFDETGRSVFIAPEKMDTLARGFARCVGKGRDNEVFVILADLVDLHDRLGPFLSRVKIALAKHHRIVVLCAWPDGLPLPGMEPSEQHGIQEIPAIIGSIHRHRKFLAYEKLRAELGRLRVSLMCARDPRAVDLVLGQLEKARGGRVFR